MKKYFMAFLLISLTACSSVTKGDNLMLSEIYATKKPIGFEQINVNDLVLKYIPLGTDKKTVLSTLHDMKFTNIKEESNEQIFARHTMGAPMFDPDARSVVITFSFDINKKLTNVEAIYLKAQ